MTAGHVGPEASIVIRCLNEVEHIGRLLQGLKEQTFRDFEIIVVDSGSTDGTLDVVTKDDVQLLHIQPQDFSFGRSLNMGCEAANGRYLVAISAHCYPEDSLWLENLLASFRDDDVGVAYGRQRGHPESHFSEHRIFQKWFPDQRSARQEGPFCNNANCAVRAELWRGNGYDENLTGLEDIAFARDAMRDGWRVAYEPDASVIHVHYETRAQTRNRYRREAMALQALFPNEHFNLLDFARLFAGNVVGDIRAAAREGRLVRAVPGVLGFRLAQFWGTYQGFHTRRPVTSELKRHLYYPD